MHTTISLTTVLATTLPSVVLAHSSTIYKLSEDLSYHNFFSAFDFYSGPDPTEGFVQYRNYTSAVEQGLVGYFADEQSVYIGVDHKSKDPDGRASVRLESKKGWDKGLLIADILHMPASTCGSWPAYWLVGSDAEENGSITWPESGEVDILEGVNDYTTNAVTLHTAPGCTVDNTTSAITGSDSTSLSFSGFLKTENCDVNALDQDKNVGCSITAPSHPPPDTLTPRDPSTKTPTFPSYGTPFNAAGGGIYALELTSTSITVWLIPRASPRFTTLFPIRASKLATLDTAAFGLPIARFTGQCDFDARFRHLKVVFDTTFCGVWAGEEWVRGGCAARTGVRTCEEYVRENAGAYAESYWEVAGLTWFVREST